MKVVVAGGGASGMMAAISAADEGAQVVLLEHKDRVGKKILSTGNGKCNFTNLLQEPICYHSESPMFPWGIIEKFTSQDAVAFFLQLGIYSKNKNGYMYPNSDQASSVLDVLRIEMQRLQIEVKTDTECKEVHKEKQGFSVRTDKGKIKCDRVILAMGSRAASKTGSDGSGYNVAKALGHRIVPVLPGLTALRCKEKFYKSIAGVRVTGKVSIFADGECLAEDRGEVQLTEYGISGIPVFQISRYAAIGLYEKKAVHAVLNFMPDFTEEQLSAFLKARILTRPGKTADEFFIGLFHKKLAELWIRQSKIKWELPVSELTEKDIQKLVLLIQKFETDIESVNSYEQAQVCRGGVDTREVNPDTLESLVIPGVYFAGEILDVDGMCGGYNLQWAWASGHVAGRQAVCDFRYRKDGCNA